MTFDAIILVRELGSGSHWKVHKTERSGLSDLSTMIAEEYIVVSYVKADSTSSRTENDDAEELAHNSLEIVLGYAFLDSATRERKIFACGQSINVVQVRRYMSARSF